MGSDVYDKYSKLIDKCRHSGPVKADDLKKAAEGTVMMYFTESDMEELKRVFFEEELPRRQKFHEKYCR